VNRLDDVGTSVIENLITALVAEEVRVNVEVKRLQLGTHGAIANEYTAVQCGEELGRVAISHE